MFLLCWGAHETLRLIALAFELLQSEREYHKQKMRLWIQLEIKQADPKDAFKLRFNYKTFSLIF